MKAFVRIDATSQDVELLNVARPEIHADEVLIKVAAFGVGIHDRYFIPPSAKFPYIIGSESAGTIVEIGRDVNGFNVNDRVIFTTVLQDQGGSWAEYAVAKQTALISLPDNLTMAQGAAVPIAGKTALECLNALNLKKEDLLFIAGGSGAIGTLTIQLASKKGNRIAASASKKNHSYMKSLGAEKTVDYNDVNWINEVKEWSNGGVNAAMAIQPGTGSDSIKVVKDGGALIMVSGDAKSVSPERSLSIAQIGHHKETHQKVIALVQDISKGEIQIVLEKEYTFEHALDALQKTETRHARGKLVVKL